MCRLESVWCLLGSTQESQRWRAEPPATSSHTLPPSESSLPVVRSMLAIRSRWLQIAASFLPRRHRPCFGGRHL